MKIILYFSVIFCLAKVHSQQNDQICSSNEVYDRCLKPCQPTCATPTPPNCNSGRCEEGCKCKPNLIRNRDSEECVRPHQCPRVQTCNTSNNEQYYECQSPCPRTCQSQCRPRQICSAVRCESKCDCKPGYLRNELTSQCVPERFCPKCRNCPQNEVYSQCNAGCERTCQNPEGSSCLSNYKQCISGCVCRQGLIRDEISRRCITQQKCRQIQEENYST